MAVDTSIKVSRELRERIYWLKGPGKSYEEFISELVKEKESRSHSAATTETGNLTKETNNV